MHVHIVQSWTVLKMFETVSQFLKVSAILDGPLKNVNILRFDSYR